MTEPTEPAKQSREGRLTACLVWVITTGTAVLEVGLLAPVISKHAVSAWDEADLYVALGTLALLWLWTLVWERTYWYDRRKARATRRAGWFAQLVLLGVNTIGGRPQLLITIVDCLFVAMSATIFASWMRTLRLHPDDQTVIDELIIERNAERHQHFEERLQRHREVRLQQALNALGRPDHEPPKPDDTKETEQRITWRIPQGTHHPVVYFLRNGNRIKIGTTTNLHQRVRRLSLRMDNVALILSGGPEVERALHRQFKSARVGNTEWFREDGPLQAFIANQIEHLKTAALEGE